LQVEGVNYRIEGNADDLEGTGNVGGLQDFIERYQAYIMELDLKEIEEDDFLLNNDYLTSLKEPFVHNLFLNHKISKFESLMQEKDLKRLLSFEDL